MTTLQARRDRSELVDRLLGLSVGEIHIVSVDVWEEYWPDDQPTQFVVHLSDPDDDAWDDDDLSQLTSDVYAVLAEFGALRSSRTSFTGGLDVADVPTPDEDSIGPE